MLPKATGGYTSSQVNEALRGIAIPQKYRYRFALLDRNLNFIRNLRGVERADISYDREATIKRSLTATIREVSLPFDPFADVVMGGSPRVFLRLAETSGTTATDSSGNGHTGTYTGGVALNQESLLETDSLDRAARFDGTDDRVTIASNAAFNVASVGVGIRCKLTPNGSTQVLAARDDLGSNRQWALWTGTNFTEFYVRISGVTHKATISATIADNNLYDVFGVYDGTYVRLYIDGFEIARTPATGTFASVTLTMNIGEHSNGTSRAKGILDEFQFYDRAPSAAEIRDRYQAGSGDFSEINYYTDLIQPWVGIRMLDGGYAEWPRGVYKPYRFPRQFEDTATYRAVAANDLASILINDKFTARWTISAGQNYITGTNGVLDILESAGFDTSSLNYAPTTKTLPATIDFEIGDSTVPNKLAAVNKLLKDINYDDLWFDAYGRPIIQAHEEPYDRTSEESFIADRQSILSADEMAEDLSTEDVYNVVYLYVASPDRDTILTSTGQNALPSSPVSIYQLGRKPWIEKVEAPDQTTLDNLRRRTLTEKTMVHKPIRVSIMPWPLFEHQDRITISDDRMGMSRECLVRRLREPLIDGGDWTQFEADIVVNPN